MPRDRARRRFTTADLFALLAGVGVFVLLVSRRPSNRGALVAALAAGATAGAVWLLWWLLRRPASVERLVAAPKLGAIPVDPVPAPVIAEPKGKAATAFRTTLEHLEVHTHGQVLLVSSPAPGHGATTVAMNLAAAATQAGRRCVLVDADTSGRGVSRFLGTGPNPGLLDVAQGRAGLAAASRMWTVAPDARLPMIPIGHTSDDPRRVLEGDELSETIERLADAADLVIIDTPPVLWNGDSLPLAAHADGTVLVVSDQAPTDGVVEAAERLGEAGAPIVGLVANRADTRARLRRHPATRALVRVVAVTLLVGFGFLAFTGAQLLRSWQQVDRDVVDVDAAETILPLPSGLPDLAAADTGDSEDVARFSTAVPHTGDGYRSFLVVGGDAVAGAADVIILTVLPDGGDPPFMVSLPRDLYVPNRCTGGYTRINATIHGCDAINGPTLLALTVEDFTGLEVHHLVRFDFDGFKRIIDAVGGVEICVEYPVRDRKSGLDLPAGCTIADGEQALAWVRSRHTLQYVDGRWRRMPGAGDLMRNQHQQEVILELLSELKDFSSPDELTRAVAAVSDAFTLDDDLGLAEAIALAWSLRDLDPSEVRRLEIPVRLTSNSKGQSILVPTAPFSDVLAEAYPEFVDGADTTARGR
ncbi:MAG TPA: hypothetical protein ENK55_07755 [Actinobacteria bacterium]|nr:hypothetical protein [Actinomycetota bacterium]